MLVFYGHTIQVLCIDYEYMSNKSQPNVGKINIRFISKFEKN